MNTLFVEQLTTLDFSYLCPVEGLVGETWLVDLTLSGTLDAEGMLFDFGHIKTEVRNRLEAWIDHCLVAPTACDSLRMQQGQDVSDVTLVLDKGGQIQCQAPAASIVGLPVKAVTPALLTPLAQEAIAPVLPDNIHEARIRLYPQAIEGAWYRYSHGLKKHKGACQRIAHGHRSQLWVEVNGERHTAIEQRVAQQWDTVYLGSRDDLQGELAIDGQTHYQFGYSACQGNFRLLLPAAHCHLMETDTTVEQIADHLAVQLGHENPDCQIRVRACEGYRKGAIATQPPCQARAPSSAA